MTEKPFENLLGANLEIRNEQGELVFALKRKGEKYRKIYYIFELHQDRMNPEQLAKFPIMWSLIKIVAATETIHKLVVGISEQPKENKE